MNEIICPSQIIMNARVPSSVGRLSVIIELVIVLSMVVSPLLGIILFHQKKG
jgi:hypothetical protein